MPSTGGTSVHRSTFPVPLMLRARSRVRILLQGAGALPQLLLLDRAYFSGVGGLRNFAATLANCRGKSPSFKVGSTRSLRPQGGRGW